MPSIHHSGTVTLSAGQEKRTTTAKEFPLGTRAILGEKVFRYARNGATALVPAQLCQMATTIALGLHVGDTVAPVPDTGVAIGGRTILMDLPSTHDTIDADVFADGWMNVIDGPNEGHVYRISPDTHPLVAVDDATQLTLVLAYDDPVVDTALTTASLLGVHRNYYDRVVPVGIDTTLNGPVGVSPAEVPADSYFWLQTFGPCLVRAETGTRYPTLGREVIAALSTSGFDGAVEMAQEIATALDVVDTVNQSGWAEAKVGFAYGVITGDTAADDQQIGIWLTLAP